MVQLKIDNIQEHDILTNLGPIIPRRFPHCTFPLTAKHIVRKTSKYLK